MSDKLNFLCEIGTEEIPAGYLPPAIANLEKGLVAALDEARIGHGQVRILATPRRLAMMVCGLENEQREEQLELKGPAVDRAYDEHGKPTKALEGFLRGNNVEIKDLVQKDTGKGEYIFAYRNMESRKTLEVLPEMLTKVVNGLPFPKRMRWNTKTVGFPRPIRYIMALYNDEVPAFELDGIKAGRSTRGHYVQSPEMFEVTSIADYENQLADRNVVLDHGKRRAMIATQLEKKAGEHDLVLVQDDDLLDIVTFLVENPVVVACRFEESFLDVPDVVLITEMKEHQKYFALRKKDGSLSNMFLVVANNPETPYVIQGNERVIRARFNDARFFVEEDRKYRLEDKVESLKRVVFHKELGTIYDKVLRMQQIAGILATELGIDAKTAGLVDRALLLCKADLNTALVTEFTSLQGQIGRIYALRDGEPKEVADAIDDHYRPRFHGDAVPEGIVAVLVSLSEKIDNLLGAFSVGNIPKGSQDPYALRRQAQAIIDLLVSRKLHVQLDSVLKGAAKNYQKGDTLVQPILEFVAGRAKTYFQDREIRYDEVEACLSLDYYDYYELYMRACSVHSFRQQEQFSAMLLAFKRMNNIVSSFRQKNKEYKLVFDANLLADEAEKSLFGFFDQRKNEMNQAVTANNYELIFKLLIEAQPVINRFFDDVMVMDKDEKIRDNRLALLEDITGRFSNLLNFNAISD